MGSAAPGDLSWLSVAGSFGRRADVKEWLVDVEGTAGSLCIRVGTHSLLSRARTPGGVIQSPVAGVLGWRTDVAESVVTKGLADVGT